MTSTVSKNKRSRLYAEVKFCIYSFSLAKFFSWVCLFSFSGMKWWALLYFTAAPSRHHATPWIGSFLSLLIDEKGLRNDRSIKLIIETSLYYNILVEDCGQFCSSSSSPLASASEPDDAALRLRMSTLPSRLKRFVDENWVTAAAAVV